MSQLRLTELRVESFRGATTRTAIRFDNKPLVVVFGENGTGKTTLVDALDLIANNHIGSIEDRSSASMKHAPSIGKKPAEIKVVLERGSDKWEGSLSKSKVSVTPHSPKPVISVLRRSQLLRLVEAQPAKRYDELKGFIDVSVVARAESELEAAVKAESKTLSSAAESRVTSEEQLRALWEENGGEGEWREWAEDQSALSTSDLDESLSEITGILSSYDEFERERDKRDAAEQSLRAARDERDAVQAANDAVVETSTQQLIATLSAANTLLESDWDSDACPVCKQEIARGELQEHVSSSLAALQSARESQERRAEAEKLVNAMAERLSQQQRDECEGFAGLLTLLSQSQVPAVRQVELNYEKLIGDLKADWESTGVPLHVTAELPKLEALKAELLAERDSKQRIRNQLCTIQRTYRTHAEAVTASTSSFAIHQTLESTLQTVRKLRVDFVQKVLDQVSEEAKRLYSEIHPNEDTKSGRLELDEKKRGSLHQYADFAGHEKIEPQGYFSDSHLDTLGFCYWLALAKRSKPESKIVVLDDVFTSVDAAHLGRIVQLIDVECDKFGQVLVFTHNRNWRDRYTLGQAASGKVHLIELQRWGANVGIRTARTPIDLDELRDLMLDVENAENPLDRQKLASKAGILLEAVFDQLSLHYQSKLPRKPNGDYTLGELMDGLATIMKVMHVQHLEEEQANNKSLPMPDPVAVKPVFDELKKHGFVRNQVGCHFNATGAGLSDDDVVLFGRATVSFVEQVTCPHCGEVPRTDKSSHRQCSCRRTRLTPAKR